MIARPVALLCLLLSFSPAAAAGDGGGGSILVHVTTVLDASNTHTAIVPVVAAGALKQGMKVILLFDGKGVRSLKVGRWFGGHSTVLDRVAIASGERQRLAAFLGTVPEGVPDNYGSLLHFLKGRGVEVRVSAPALRTEGIGDAQYDHAADQADEELIARLLAGAGAYVAY